MSDLAPGRAADSPRVRLRRATEADGDAIVELMAELGYPSTPRVAVLATLRKVLDTPSMAVYLAEMGAGIPAGLIHCSHRPQIHLGGTCVAIDALVVAADARGHGIGTRLLKRARAYARYHKAVRVEVHTNRGRESYRRGFYPAHGFVEANSSLFRLAALEGGLGPSLATTADDGEGSERVAREPDERVSSDGNRTDGRPMEQGQRRVDSREGTRA